MSRASQPVNPWIGLTFISDGMEMEVPPAWFLAKLHDYDADLVVLPSRVRPFAYVLARRARVSVGLSDKAMDRTITQLDTRMCFRHGLVPVCVFFKHGPNWSADNLLATLRSRDTWAQGGGDALADRLEAEEAQAIVTQKSAMRDRFNALGREGWKSLQYRTGQRTTVPGPSRSGAAIKSSSSSTATGITLA